MVEAERAGCEKKKCISHSSPIRPERLLITHNTYTRPPHTLARAGDSTSSNCPEASRSVILSLRLDIRIRPSNVAIGIAFYRSVWSKSFIMASMACTTASARAGTQLPLRCSSRWQLIKQGQTGFVYAVAEPIFTGARIGIGRT